MPTHDELRALVLLTFLVGLGSVLTWLDAQHPERLALLLGDSLHLAAGGSSSSDSGSGASSFSPEARSSRATASGDGIAAATDRVTPTRGATGPASALEGGLDVNRASEAELVLLPGVGPVTAHRIVEHRRAHGPFRRVADLSRVKGIGPKTLAKLLPYVRATAAKDST